MNFAPIVCKMSGKYNPNTFYSLCLSSMQEKYFALNIAFSLLLSISIVFNPKMQYIVISQWVYEFKQKFEIENTLNSVAFFFYNYDCSIDFHLMKAIFHAYNLEKMHLKCLNLNFKMF